MELYAERIFWWSAGIEAGSDPRVGSGSLGITADRNG